MTKSRREILGGIAAGLGAPAFLRGQTKKKPNVILLLTDDQRQDTVSALGNPHIQTPNLDSLVRSGVTFNNAYCMGGFSPAVCLPSRMMIQRGRSWFHIREQQPGYPNIARSMSEAGYTTFHLGKKGNEDTQSHKSYDVSGTMEPNDAAERDLGLPGKQLAERTMRYLDDWKRGAAGGGKPFFMYLAGPAPHDPRNAPPEYLARYDARKLPLPPNYLPYHPFDNGELLIRDEKLAPWPRTEEEVRKHLRDYYAVITHMDEQYGRIFAKLKSLGEYENTIVVFTSDQGIAIGSHGLMGKQNLYEHSMRSGMVVTGPGIPRGRRVNGYAYLFDIFPTLCDLVGAKIPESLEGRSQAPVILGKRASVRDEVFLGYRDFQRAVRRGKWKLIRYPGIGRNQLFDLEADPFEVKDLAGAPAHRAKVEELTALMREQQSLYGDALPLTAEKTKPGEVDLEYFRRAG